MGDLYDLKHIVILTQQNFEFVTYRSHIKAIQEYLEYSVRGYRLIHPRLPS